MAQRGGEEGGCGLGGGLGEWAPGARARDGGGATAGLWALGERARDGGGAGIWVRGLAQLFDVDKKRTNLS